MSDDEDQDDPFSKDFDGDESDEEQDLDKLGPRSAPEDEEDEGDESEGEDEDEQTPDTDLSDDGEVQAGTSAVKEMMRDEATGQKWLAASMSQAQKDEVEKGRAVKKQRTAFDSLLGARMKLQKALIGVNTLSGDSGNEITTQSEEATDVVEAAEAAAFKLWSSLNELREDLFAAKIGLKRKRTHFSLASPTDELWQSLKAQEEDSLSSRQAILQKWSIKARAASTLATRDKLNNNVQQATIMDVIKEHLSNPERLLKRAHTPRSCAPVQLANNVIEDDKIYDDADFYGLLLKELLEQKSQDSVAASTIDVNFGQMRREAKTKKNVDTKASKGRKLRYTVHEKLQNFMAPEDRSTWGERQTDELFGSLFGQRMALAEVDGDGVNGEVEYGLDPVEASLMLFRS